MGQNLTGDFRIGRGITDHVFVDVDGTLLLWPTKAGSPREEEIAVARQAAADIPLQPHEVALMPRVNTELVAALREWYDAREAAGGRPTIVVWTMGGPVHAIMAAELCGLLRGSELLNVVCVGKPDMIVDDALKPLIPKHPQVKPEDFKCPAS